MHFVGRRVPQRAAGTALPAGKRHFLPTAEWREVERDMVCPPGLEYRLDFESGKNFARLAPGGSTPDVGAALPGWLEAAVSAGGGARAGAAAGAAAGARELRNAVTWGGRAAVEAALGGAAAHPRGLLAEQLGDAAAQGDLPIVETLLRHGAPADGDDGAPGAATTPLHRACQEGHEHVAAALVAALGSRERAFARNGGGLTPFELARARDLGGVARRLEAQVDARWPRV